MVVSGAAEVAVLIAARHSMRGGGAACCESDTGGITGAPVGGTTGSWNADGNDEKFAPDGLNP